MSETWTIARILSWCGGYFNDKGIESPRLDAELLLAHVLALPRIQLYVQFDRPLAATELTTFKALVKRRALHEPIAYIIGARDFWSRSFAVTPATLIPRPESELLIEIILKQAKTRPLLHGCDIGTGSGCLAITLLTELPSLAMVAVDISPEAITVAAKNAATHGVASRLTLCQKDFFSDSFGDTQATYDVIVSNPPYISEDEILKLPQTVRDFEPKTALAAGADGLRFYPELARFAMRSLNPTGCIAVEIGEEQGPAVSAIFSDAGLANVSVKKDYAGNDRVVIANKP